jgi:hypothetical protein
MVPAGDVPIEVARIFSVKRLSSGARARIWLQSVVTAVRLVTTERRLLHAKEVNLARQFRTATERLAISRPPSVNGASSAGASWRLDFSTM